MPFGTYPAHARHLLGTERFFTFVLACLIRLLQYMAKISGFMNSRWSGKVGNVCFRTQEGQVIAAEMPKKKDPAITKLPGEIEREKVFALISRFAKAHAASIDVSFNDVKLGTPRNYFMKVNYSGLKAAFASLTIDATDTEIEQAVEEYATDNPTAIYRVKKNGVPTEYLTGAWDDSANPVSGVVTLGGSRLVAGTVAPALTTGQTLSIVGSGLSGAVVLVTASELGGSTTDNQSATALTGLTQNDSSINANIAAALNGKYLVSIKVGGATIISLKNTNAGGMG